MLIWYKNDIVWTYLTTKKESQNIRHIIWYYWKWDCISMQHLGDRDKGCLPCLHAMRSSWCYFLHAHSDYNHRFGSVFFRREIPESCYMVISLLILKHCKHINHARIVLFHKENLCSCISSKEFSANNTRGGFERISGSCVLSWRCGSKQHGHAFASSNACQTHPTCTLACRRTRCVPVYITTTSIQLSDGASS
jgi:hypothetical protein